MEHSQINNLHSYLFSKVIECLEQNVRKPSNTKQMNRVENL